MARGAMLFVFFHETGHMLISEMKLPATVRKKIPPTSSRLSS